MQPVKQLVIRQQTIDKIAILAQRMKDGDMSAFDECYDLTKNSVIKRIRSCHVREADIEDVVQSVYLKIYQELPNINDAQAATDWINRVTINTALNFIKTAYNRHEVLSVDRESVMEDESEGYPMLENSAYTDRILMNAFQEPEIEVEENECQQIMNDIMRALPERQYQIMRAYYYYELKIEEIARLFDVKPGTVKASLYSGRENLKKGINRYQKETGTKLYSVSLLPLLLFYFQSQTSQEMVPKSLDISVKAIAGENMAVEHAAEPTTPDTPAGKAGTAGKRATADHATSGQRPESGRIVAEGGTKAIGQTKATVEEGISGNAATAGKAATTASHAATVVQTTASGSAISIKTVAVLAALAIGGAAAGYTGAKFFAEYSSQEQAEEMSEIKTMEESENKSGDDSGANETTAPTPTFVPTVTPAPDHTPMITPTAALVQEERNRDASILAMEAIDCYRDFLNNKLVSYETYQATLYRVADDNSYQADFWSNGSEASEGKNALSEYAIYDLDSDDVPELMLVGYDGFDYGRVYIFRAEEGKIAGLTYALADDTEVAESYVTKRIDRSTGMSGWYIAGFSAGDSDTGQIVSSRINDDLSGVMTEKFEMIGSQERFDQDQWEKYAEDYLFQEAIKFFPITTDIQVAYPAEATEGVYKGYRMLTDGQMLTWSPDQVDDTDTIMAEGAADWGSNQITLTINGNKYPVSKLTGYAFVSVADINTNDSFWNIIINYSGDEWYDSTVVYAFDGERFEEVMTRTGDLQLNLLSGDGRITFYTKRTWRAGDNDFITFLQEDMVYGTHVETISQDCGKAIESRVESNGYYAEVTEYISGYEVTTASTLTIYSDAKLEEPTGTIDSGEVITITGKDEGDRALRIQYEGKTYWLKGTWGGEFVGFFEFC